MALVPARLPQPRRMVMTGVVMVNAPTAAVTVCDLALPFAVAAALDASLTC